MRHLCPIWIPSSGTKTPCQCHPITLVWGPSSHSRQECPSLLHRAAQAFHDGDCGTGMWGKSGSFCCFHGSSLATCGARAVGLTHLHSSVLALGRVLIQAGVTLVTMGAQATLGKDSPHAWPQALGRLCCLSSCSICLEFFKERAISA